MEQADTAELRSALRWWLESGVDVATADEPRGWLKVAEAPVQTVVDAPPSAPESLAIPESFESFGKWLGSAPDLPFATAGARRFAGAGPANALLMLLADMPALDAELDQAPLGGDALALARRMLAAIGLGPEEVYWATLSCFNSHASLGRGPDLDACADIARKHVALAAPKSLLLLGEAPCRALLGKPLAQARGHVHRVEGIAAVATFHPNFLLNKPGQKANAWADLLLLTEDR